MSRKFEVFEESRKELKVGERITKRLIKREEERMRIRKEIEVKSD